MCTMKMCKSGQHCNKTFRKWHNFFDHLRMHTGERPFVCPYEGCSEKFTQRANLNKHIEVHIGLKKFNCPDCDKKFFTRFNLRVSIHYSSSNLLINYRAIKRLISFGMSSRMLDLLSKRCLFRLNRLTNDDEKCLIVDKSITIYYLYK